MAIGVSTNFKIYQPQINGAFFEEITQMINAFNGASAGAIMLKTEQMKGDYDYESFFEEGPDVGRRDPDDVTARTDNAMTQDEIVRVKLHRDYSQALTRNQWLRIGQSPERFSFIYGQQMAKKVLREQLNSGLAAAVAAIEAITTGGPSGSGLVLDITGATVKTMNHDALNTLNGRFGDASGEIVCYVMHSKPWFNLIGSAISTNIFQETFVAINQGTTGTFGRPVIVTDSASLISNAGGTAPNHYHTLGLTRSAIQCVDTEAPFTASEMVTGLKNLVTRLQTEYAYNLGIKGFKWDVANGGKNPTAGTLATASNWDQAMTDLKMLAGISCISL